ncbi:MAG: (d)CMP kinase [Bacteroidales bacterium]|nr:(d)CMP kinase [Bacteroidales bacterium]
MSPKKFSPHIIIAIDGHSSCGKSTLARQLARKLNFTYIDSGAMYRAVTLAAIRENIVDGIEIDELRLNILLQGLTIKFAYNSSKLRQEIYINNENVEEEIRDIEVSDSVSIISKSKMVRENLVSLQRKMSKNKRIVMDGRDIGTVVFPEAELKIFMTANEEVRAQRRFMEMKEKGSDIKLESVQKNIHYRDFIDQTRDESPLRQAPDAIVLDNSELTIEESLNWVMNLLLERFPVE